MFTYDTYTTLIVSVKLPNIPGCSPEDAETNAREKYSQLSERLTNLSSEQFPHMRIAVDHIDEIEIGKALFEERKYVEKIKDNGTEKQVEVNKMTAYFKSDWLQKFLKKNDFKDFNSTEMMAHIRNKLGGGDARRKIKGKTAYLWYLPWQRKNQDELKTPDMGEDTPF